MDKVEINDFQKSVSQIFQQKLKENGNLFEVTTKLEDRFPIIVIRSSDLEIIIHDSQIGFSAGKYSPMATEIYQPLTYQSFVEMVWPEIKFFLDNPGVREPIWRYKLKKAFRSLFKF